MSVVTVREEPSADVYNFRFLSVLFCCIFSVEQVSTSALVKVLHSFILSQTGMPGIIPGVRAVDSVNETRRSVCHSLADR